MLTSHIITSVTVLHVVGVSTTYCCTLVCFFGFLRLPPMGNIPTIFLVCLPVPSFPPLSLSSFLCFLVCLSLHPLFFPISLLSGARVDTSQSQSWNRHLRARLKRAMGQLHFPCSKQVSILPPSHSSESAQWSPTRHQLLSSSLTLAKRRQVLPLDTERRIVFLMTNDINGAQ